MTAALSLSVFWFCTISVSGCQHENHCFNKTCEYVNANPKCILGCEDGRSGNNCEELCRNLCRACERSDPYRCTRCDKGRYGDTCEEHCNKCVDDECYHNGTCVSGYTAMIAECADGCKNGSCDMETGKCKDGCLNGWAGPTCGVNCTSFCKECHEGQQNASDCSMCDDCPDNCLQCDGCGKCEKCALSWYTSNCSKSCSVCKNMLCEQDGKCVDGCNEGYTGSICHVSNTDNTDTNILSLILAQVKNNDLFLPLLICALVLFAAFTGILIWRCKRKRHEKSPSCEDSQCLFIRKEKTECPEMVKCGDVYHEIADEDLDTVVSKRQSMLSERPRLPPPQNTGRPLLPPTQNTVNKNSQPSRVPGDGYMTPLDDTMAGDLHTTGSTGRADKLLPPPRDFTFPGNQDVPLASHDRPKQSCSRLGRTLCRFPEGQCNDISTYDQGYLLPNQTALSQADINVNTSGSAQTELMSDIQCASLCNDNQFDETKPTACHVTARTMSGGPMIATPCKVQLSCEF